MITQNVIIGKNFVLPRDTITNCEITINGFDSLSYSLIRLSDSYGNRTRVTAVKGRCLNRLTKEPQSFVSTKAIGSFLRKLLAKMRAIVFCYHKVFFLYLHKKTPRVGLEPTTPRLTAVCSTIELSRNKQSSVTQKTLYNAKKIILYKFNLVKCNFIFSHLSNALYIQNHTLVKQSFSSRSLERFAYKVKPSTYQYLSATYITVLPPQAYLPRRLQGVLLTYSQGYLILRGASRLDAFSVYPVPTWLPGDALGSATGTPEVSPPRSSRTKGSSSQISYARAGQGPNCLTTF